MDIRCTTDYLRQAVSERCATLPRSFESEQALSEYRAKVRRWLSERLGLPRSFSGEGAVSASATLGGDIRFEHLDIQVDGDYRIYVHLYLPEAAKRPPVVMVCPGYLQDKNAPDVVDLCMALARSGLAALAMEYPGAGECAGRPDGATDLDNVCQLALLLGLPEAAIRVWHNLAALAYLKMRKDLDANRLGITGLCQGAITLWYTALVSDAFKALSPVCGTTSLWAEAVEYTRRQGGWSGVSPFIPGMLDYADVPQLYACMAPRPLLVMNNMIDIHWPLSGFGQTRHVAEDAYALLGAKDRCQFLLEHEPHAFRGQFIAHLVRWFGEVL